MFTAFPKETNPPVRPSLADSSAGHFERRLRKDNAVPCSIVVRSRMLRGARTRKYFGGVTSGSKVGQNARNEPMNGTVAVVGAEERRRRLSQRNEK